MSTCLTSIRDESSEQKKLDAVNDLAYLRLVCQMASMELPLLRNSVFLRKFFVQGIKNKTG